MAGQKTGAIQQSVTRLRIRACLQPLLRSARKFALLALSNASEKITARTAAPKLGMDIRTSTACPLSISFIGSTAF